MDGQKDLQAREQTYRQRNRKTKGQVNRQAHSQSNRMTYFGRMSFQFDRVL